MMAKQHTITVIFEVEPANGKKQEYLDMAANLGAELEKIKGFISIERFQSIYNPEKILSLSVWENEEAVKQWRNLDAHRKAQAIGRESIFQDYRIRIAQVIRDYGINMREEAPPESKSFHSKRPNR